jgi:hypothetical protein
MWMTLVVIGLSMLFFVAAFIISIFENHPVRMFERADLPPFTPYIEKMIGQAQQHGFRVACGGHHTRFKDKLPGVLLISEDGLTLAIIGEGTILKMPTRKTLLMSLLMDKRVLITVDEAGTGELDPGTHRQILMHADFHELIDKHSKWLQTERMQVAIMDDDWSSVDQITRLRVRRMVDAGYARYVDTAQEHYRNTAWGSFLSTIVHGLQQILRPTNYIRHLRRG